VFRFKFLLFLKLVARLVIMQDIMKWLPKSEDRLHKMAPPAAEIRPVRIQLEELKVRSLMSTTDFSSAVVDSILSQ